MGASAARTWPLEPEMLRSSLPTAAFEGIGHQGSKGSGWGTALRQIPGRVRWLANWEAPKTTNYSRRHQNSRTLALTRPTASCRNRQHYAAGGESLRSARWQG
eukprot:COSAG05_NODE_18519_length_307_cov_0.735577_1_plen_102_part_11